jgi:hypothetical protein
VREITPELHRRRMRGVDGGGGADAATESQLGFKSAGNGMGGVGSARLLKGEGRT